MATYPTCSNLEQASRSVGGDRIQIAHEETPAAKPSGLHLFSFRSHMQPDSRSGPCRTLSILGGEIGRMRLQVHRQRGEIKQLQRAGIPTASADALLNRMLGKIDSLCAERDRLKKEGQPMVSKGKALGGRTW